MPTLSPPPPKSRRLRLRSFCNFWGNPLRIALLLALPFSFHHDASGLEHRIRQPVALTASTDFKWLYTANGKGGSDARDREIRDLKSQLEERDQVIGELTVANRIFKKLSGQSP